MTATPSSIQSWVAQQRAQAEEFNFATNTLGTLFAMYGGDVSRVISALHAMQVMVMGGHG